MFKKSSFVHLCNFSLEIHARENGLALAVFIASPFPLLWQFLVPDIKQKRKTSKKLFPVFSFPLHIKIQFFKC